MGRIILFSVATLLAAFGAVGCAMKGELGWTIFGALLVGWDLQMLISAIEDHNKKETE